MIDATATDLSADLDLATDKIVAVHDQAMVAVLVEATVPHKVPEQTMDNRLLGQ